MNTNRFVNRLHCYSLLWDGGIWYRLLWTESRMYYIVKVFSMGPYRKLPTSDWECAFIIIHIALSRCSASSHCKCLSQSYNISIHALLITDVSWQWWCLIDIWTYMALFLFSIPSWWMVYNRGSTVDDDVHVNDTNSEYSMSTASTMLPYSEILWN